MNKIYLFVDIDNTLIYSKKFNDDMRVVEIYRGRPINYMTEYSYKMLNELHEADNLEIVPITTRTSEQYSRIDFPKFQHVILENGAVLKSNNETNQDWYSETLRLNENYKDNLLDIYSFLKHKYDDKFLIKLLDDIILVIIGANIGAIQKDVPDFYNLKCYNNGKKIYIFPEFLTKAFAISRFKKSIDKESLIISAGDNELFDLCMLSQSDLFINEPVDKNLVYSDVILKMINEIVWGLIWEKILLKLQKEKIIVSVVI